MSTPQVLVSMESHNPVSLDFLFDPSAERGVAPTRDAPTQLDASGSESRTSGRDGRCHAGACYTRGSNIQLYDVLSNQES